MTSLIAWTDVETSGTDAQTDELLEIATLVTDTDLNILDDKGFEAIILYSPDRVQDIRNGADKIVQDMHDASGLWDLLPEGELRSEVDSELYNYWRSFCFEPHKMMMGGNSLRLDLNFTEKWLPEAYSHLHYRSIDVTSVSLLAGWWMDIPNYKKKGSHRAMGDIRECLAELKYLKDKMGLHLPEAS